MGLLPITKTSCASKCSVRENVQLPTLEDRFAVSVCSWLLAVRMDLPFLVLGMFCSNLHKQYSLSTAVYGVFKEHTTVVTSSRHAELLLSYVPLSSCMQAKVKAIHNWETTITSESKLAISSCPGPMFANSRHVR